MAENETPRDGDADRRARAVALEYRAYTGAQINLPHLENLVKGAIEAALRERDAAPTTAAPDDGWRVDRPGWYWVRHYTRGPWFPSEWTGGQWTLLLMGDRYTSSSDLWCPIEIGPALSPPPVPREGEGG